MISRLNFIEAKRNLINERYNEIYAHEMAHKIAGGNFAGNIVIEKNSDGIPIGGHVSIQMPTLDKSNPENTIRHANTVIKSALAPSNPSSQDLLVASKAKEILNRAEDCKLGQKLNYLA